MMLLIDRIVVTDAVEGGDIHWLGLW